MKSPSTVTATSDAGSYFGGKGGCFRHLINQIPPIDYLYVPFAGHCAIARNISPPKAMFINDLDPSVVSWWRSTQKLPPGCRVTNRCGLECLEDLIRDSDLRRVCGMFEKSFIYLDPPYLHETRKSDTQYRFEMSVDDHVRLLAIAKELPCQIMISGYSSKLYALELRDWRHFDFPSMTRGGQATEHVWCNYTQPTELQDYRYLGENKRERFKLDRRRRNLIGKLKRLKPIERNALLAAVVTEFGVGGSGVSSSNTEREV